MKHYYFSQAQTGYGCSNYGETASYNSCETLITSQANGGGTEGSNGGLANTGVPISAVFFLALLTIAVVIALKGITKKKRLKH